MILATRYAGDRLLRAQFGDDSIPPYSASISAGASGQRVTTATASGLTAVGRAIRLHAGLIASLRLLVFEGRRGDRVERPDSQQAFLLEQPALGMSLFDWLWDVASSLEASENAYLRKARTSDGKVVQLYPLPLECVNAKIERGRKVFDVHSANGWERLGEDDVLHIRGQTIGGGPFGVSRIHQHRDPLGAQLAAQKFEGAHFRNHARPGLVVSYPAGSGVTKEQSDLWLNEWMLKYGGVENAGRPFAVSGGAEVKPVPISLKDAQFIESKQHNVEDVGRIMDTDPVLLGAEADGDTRRAALDMLLRLQVPPRLRRIELALKGDPDLFDLTSKLYPQFEVDDLMFADPQMRAEVQHKRIQSGIELPDEARADNGRPPLPDGLGQIPQITPVGGAPNPALNPDTQE